MKILLRNILIVFITIVGTQIESKAQTSYYMKDYLWSSYYNPAVDKMSGKWFVGIPILSPLKVSVRTNGLKYHDIISPKKGTDSLEINLSTLEENVRNYNLISSDVRIGILSGAWKYKNNIFSLSINERVQSNFFFHKELITLLNKGNAHTIGAAITSEPFGGSAIYYREYSLGYTRIVKERLRYGGQLKFLTGIIGAKTKDLALTLRTDEGVSYVDIFAQGEAFVSAPVSFNYDEFGFISGVESNFTTSSFVGFDNLGFGFSGGVEYDLSEKATMGLSVVDIGFIRWKNNATHLVEDGTYRYKGVEVDFTNGNIDVENSYEGILDSIKSSLRIENDSTVFTTSLPFSMYGFYSYQFSERFKLGAVGRLQMIHQKAHSSLTLSGNAIVTKYMNLSMSYAVVNGTYDNIGIMLGFTGGPFHFYLGTENVVGYFNLANAKNIDFEMGMALQFKKEKKRACLCF